MTGLENVLGVFHAHTEAQGPILQVKRGIGLKGPTYGLSAAYNTFLPGDRYFLLDVYAARYSGKLLIDTRNGLYKELPIALRAYVNANSSDVKLFRVTTSGIALEESRSTW